MVLEATMIIMDNSEFSRNGDYVPTRFLAQADAVPLIFQAKTQANPESTVGLMTMGGSSPEVLATMSAKVGRILGGIHSTSVHGTTHFANSIQVASLVLKHRQNKVQRQRIIAFVASPVEEDDKELTKIAKKMKKNNVAIDIINFGQVEENTEKLEKFINTVNSNDNSHIVTVPPGPNLLSDIVASSPILNDGESGVPAGGSGFGDFDLGVDASADPELALALKMSLEEEKARQDREKAKREADQAGTSAEDGGDKMDTDK